ncbi:MAG: hypothetical protein ACD_50C00083G0006 [uncultured bacterium]|nr:MAG: hypothetical protein ACD_50C00083G0006 [uncultured bacterium]OGH13199.1 MAG: hypothetical protein A2687_00670 [Candidatus Levybacteria bacterium RIFCSPHIGHO2_01_FULL_38_26]
MTELNWIDFVILIVLLFYSIEGFVGGFITSILDLVSFVVSFVTGLKYYGVIGAILVDNFSIPQGFSNAIGFFTIAFLLEMVIKLILGRIANARILSSTIYSKVPGFRFANRFLGIIPGLLSGFILVAFLLTLVVALPLSGFIKQSIASSKIGNQLVRSTQGFEKDLNGIFGEAVNETLNFLTVAPQSTERIDLNFQVTDFSVDRESEQSMLLLVNQERGKHGVSAVIFDEPLAEVGRRHCEDMFRRGYFSHDTPEGLSPFDRMDNADISYNYAGENLALAPDVRLAMQGLMNSPGHRENILSPNFGKLGVGVIDGGIYGKMFCQEFTD